MNKFVVYDSDGSVLGHFKELNCAIRYGHQWQLLFPPPAKEARYRQFRIYDNSIKSALVYDSKKAYRDAFAAE